jgi:hypothetical protein
VSAQDPQSTARSPKITPRPKQAPEEPARGIHQIMRFQSALSLKMVFQRRIWCIAT